VRGPLTADLRAFLDPDPHGGPDGAYSVRSLYLDSPDWSCFHAKLAGHCQRRKLRIRGYIGGDGHIGGIKFEIKHRRGMQIAKDATGVAPEDYAALGAALHSRAAIDLPRLDGSPALRDFFQWKHAHAMAPVVNVQFRRRAFVARGGEGTRVTIDDALVACRARELPAPMAAGPSLLNPACCILEIKVQRSIPYWLHVLLGKYNLQVQSISKYAVALANGPFGLDGLFCMGV